MTIETLITEEAQDFFIKAMIGNPSLFARVNHILDTEYFDEQFKKSIKFLKSYYTEYKTMPSIEIFKMATKFQGDPLILNKADMTFTSEQIACFCQLKATLNAVLKAPALIGSGKLSEMLESIKAAVQIQLHSDLGLDYFTNPHDRLMESEEEEQLIQLGWKSVDEHIFGVARQELVLVTANSGVGKSVVKLNIARNLLERGLNGVYITLEMRNNVVAKRLDSMISNIASKEIYLNKLKVGQDVEAARDKGYGRFFIKRMREGSTTTNDINSYLHELHAIHGFKPDFIVVDYLDLMAPNSKRSSENMFIKDKEIAEELRGLGFDWDSLIISSSQMGRTAVAAIRDNKMLGQDHIQGGMSKINTADLVIAIVKDEMMDAAGEYRFEILKARNSGATNKKITLRFDKNTLRIYDLDNTTNKEIVLKSEKTTLNLSDLMNKRKKRNIEKDINNE